MAFAAYGMGTGGAFFGTGATGIVAGCLLAGGASKGRPSRIAAKSASLLSTLLDLAVLEYRTCHAFRRVAAEWVQSCPCLPMLA